MDELDFDPLIKACCQRFRDLWYPGQLAPYDSILNLSPPLVRVPLLVRLIQIDLELAISRTTKELRESIIDENDLRVDPRLDLLVKRFPEVSNVKQACLELSAFEYALRRNSSEPFSIEHYLELFPQYVADLEPLLRRTEQHLFATWMSPVQTLPVDKKDSTVPDSTSEPMQVWKLPKQLGHFLLLSLAGTGGMGAVFRALDLRTGGVYAIKVMKRVDSWSVYRFNDEFRVLATLSHANLVKMYHSFVEGNLRYYSMELLNGVPIHVWWSRLRSFPERRQAEQWELLRRVLAQIASAIHFLHQRGITHGDIKCGNILVSKRGRAYLLDFGLAKIANEPTSTPVLRRGRLVGTLDYLAPEILAGQEGTAASDWYSFGIVILELVTGKTTRPSVTQGISDENVRTDRSEASAIRENILKLCEELLQPEPEDRANGMRCLEILDDSKTMSGQSVAFGISDFVGRSDELSVLDRLFDETVQSASGGVIVLDGRQGIGKSRLLNEWLRSKRLQHDCIILQAACLRKDGTPCGLINHLVQSLVAQATDAPEFDWSHWRDSIELVAKSFPQMRQLLQCQDDESMSRDVIGGDELEQLRVACQEFSRMLIELSRVKSIVLAIDDVHWADRGSLEFLNRLFDAEQSYRGLLVVASQELESYTDQAKVIETFVQGLGNVRHRPRIEWLLVSQLGHESMLALAKSLLARDGMPMQTSNENAAQLALVSNGNPLWLEEIVQMLVDDDPSGGTWAEKLVSMQGLDVLRFRLRRLSKNSKLILQYLSVAFAPVSYQNLQTATRISPEEMFPTLGELADRGWIRWHGVWPDLSCEVENRDIRDSVLALTPEDKVCRRHHRLAQALTREVPPPWRSIGQHYLNAKQNSLANAAFFQAAEDALSRKHWTELGELLPILESLPTKNKQQEVGFRELKRKWDEQTRGS